jgi:type IV secretion system protein VirD4
MKRRLIRTGPWLVAGALLWLPMTSVALCIALRTLDRISASALPVAAFYYWRDHGGTPPVARWLPLCAGGAAFLALVPVWCAMFWPPSQRLRVARAGQKPSAPRRALSDAHGSADWMSISDAASLFPGPHPAYGGVVVGEAYRVDLDKVADVRFDPGDRTTWGRGGSAPLLIDPCTADATHGAVFAGSGGYKTTAITIPTLAFWTGSAVVLDPSCQVGPMTANMRGTFGHKVVMVGPGLDGFNVLDWIDPRDPLAETHVRAVIEQVAGETRANDAGENAMFRVRGRELLTCLLADLLWNSAIPPDRKTLREFRQRVRTPEKKMRGLLADIHADSESSLARDLAGSLMDVVSETFSGIYSNAVAETQWLSIKAYADMLSGGAFRTNELTLGELTVFVQIPMDALRATPEVARVTIGALLNAVYRTQGHVRGRVLFLLDEVNFLGRLKALEDARDAGRKYGITLVSMWQSLGQLTETWGKDARTSWFNACSWRLFAVVDDEATAGEVSRMAGRYTVLARTEGTSRGTQTDLSRASRNRGTNEGLSEQPRELIRPDEVRTRMRADEAIIFRRGAPPLRCGRAIYFRRPELLARVAADRFREAAE